MKAILSLFLTCLFFNLSYAVENNEKSLSFDAELTNFDYPFDVKYFTVSSQQQSLKMAYMYLKPTSKNTVITLLHGKNFNGAYWQETAEFLHSLGYGVLIPDQIGFGKSSKPIHYQFSFAALASHTHDLLQSLEIKQSIVIGHSMGGMLASRFSLMYPEAVTKLILVNPIGLENYLAFEEYKDVQFFYEQERKKTPEGIRAYQQKNYYDGNWNNDYAKLTEFLVGQIQGPDSDIIAHVNALTYDMIFTQPVVTEFSQIRVPTALIIGTRDRTGPGRAWLKPGVTKELGRFDLLGDKIVKIIPKAHLYKLEGLGHLPQIEDFPRFTESLVKALNEESQSN